MSVFSSVQGNRVGRSVFNLSHNKRFTCDMGELIPVTLLECVPGDTMKIGCEAVTRFQPLVAPILDSVDLTVHYFFVPFRLLFDGDKDWETFITGGKDGNDTSISLPKFKFAYANGSAASDPKNPFSKGVISGKYSLWDYFGLPIPSATQADLQKIIDTDGVIGFPQRAYNLIWNEYYRDENLCDEISLDNSTVMYRAWKKDYFTSSLPWQQRGISPALPISGTIPVSFGNGQLTLSTPYINISSNSGASDYRLAANNSLAVRYIASPNPSGDLTVNSLKGTPSGLSGSVNLANATTFDVAVLREAFQIQRWMEMNARGGVRYTEFLKAHFGISPRDEVLQRPEYLGGTKSGVVISEVLQTSQTTSGESGSPQGNLSGHGLGAMSDFICSYTAKEFGYIVGIASYMPKPSYQQGVNRSFTRKTKYDFYFPEFAHLSEQAVKKGEIYATGNASDNDIFGYQSCYSELRYMPSFNCADMRDTFSYWHLGRIFSSAPSLNAGFLTTNPAYSGGIRKDIFAVQNEPGLIVNFGNVIKAVRPLPVYGTPGFIDHVGRM